MSKFKVPTTPKQIDKLIEDVYTAHFRGVEISVMEIPKLFEVALTAYLDSISSHGGRPLTAEDLYVAMAQKMKKDGAL